jgi:hypothetical protein
VGSFDDEIDAARAYDAYAVRFALGKPLNFPTGPAAKKRLGNSAKAKQLKSNLRVMTTNKATRTSRFRGVCWRDAERKWQVRIKVGGKAVSIGRFVDEIDAAYAYDAHAIVHGVRKVFRNFPELDETLLRKKMGLRKIAYPVASVAAAVGSSTTGVVAAAASSSSFVRQRAFSSSADSVASSEKTPLLPYTALRLATARSAGVEGSTLQQALRAAQLSLKRSAELVAKSNPDDAERMGAALQLALMRSAHLMAEIKADDAPMSRPQTSHFRGVSWNKRSKKVCLGSLFLSFSLSLFLVLSLSRSLSLCFINDDVPSFSPLQTRSGECKSAT